ncbi:hypothetical protein SAMN05421640_2864 [Ekhidna lutea]|uniref:Uncharacterized protein n=2 Tax=Ekhidna lutea TaxID=447679 RepID=A0A239KRL4_EKHLU|nr:hypothetical protein SAMN05421640_2864 [Ekhidna lutea]
MKRYLSLIFLCSYFLTFSQSEFKKGVYKSLNEVKQNTPSSPWEYNLISKYKTLGQANSGGAGYVNGEALFYRISIKKKEARELGSIIGFCDGRKMYMTSKLVDPSRKSSLFSPIERVNDSVYVFNQYIETTGYGPSMNMVSGSTQFAATSTASETQYILDLNGSIKELTVDYMTELLQMNDELLEEFNQTKRKEKLLLLYLFKLLDDGKSN